MAEAECDAPTRGPASARERDWMKLRPAASPSDVAGKETPGEVTPWETNSALNLIAGAFAEAVGRIWRGRRIGEYLSAPDGRRHLWHACLAAEVGIFRPDDCEAAGVAYARLTAWKGKHLVAQAYGRSAPGLLGALSRLGPRARRPKVYRSLVEVMESGGAGARFLSQSANLPDALILAVAALPPELRLKRVLRELDGDGAPERRRSSPGASAASPPCRAPTPRPRSSPRPSRCGPWRRRARVLRSRPRPGPATIGSAR